MKILVFSDSHGGVWFMQAVVKRERPDLILHLGDHDRDCIGAFAAVPVVKVRGNCDYGSDEENERILDFGVTKIWMTHGHRYHVKSGLSALMAKGKELGATILLYGHTHRAYLSKEPGLIVMNPGTPELSYGVIEMENDLVTDVRLEDAAADLAYI